MAKLPHSLEPAMRRLLFGLVCCAMLAGCGGVIDRDPKGLDPAPGWTPSR
jgi:hypothetical protein